MEFGIDLMKCFRFKIFIVGRSIIFIVTPWRVWWLEGEGGCVRVWECIVAECLRWIRMWMRYLEVGMGREGRLSMGGCWA